MESGDFEAPKLDPLTGERKALLVGNYPVGMVALMAPFTWAFGSRGAFFPSFLCVVAAVLVTARWLVAERRSAIFALILLGLPATLVGGRLAMSDTARMLTAALGLLLFFRGLVAFLDRSDSAFRLADAAQNEAFLRRLPDATQLVDLRVSSTDRLRIFRVGEPRGAAKR